MGGPLVKDHSIPARLPGVAERSFRDRDQFDVLPGRVPLGEHGTDPEARQEENQFAQR